MSCSDSGKKTCHLFAGKKHWVDLNLPSIIILKKPSPIGTIFPEKISIMDGGMNRLEQGVWKALLLE
jgi:hypothetical protein